MNDDHAPQTILVLGASGLIGRFVTDDLRARGFRVIGIARRFLSPPTAALVDIELPILSLDTAALAQLLNTYAVDTVVNCIGVLQDGRGSDTRAVHRDFVARFLQAIDQSNRKIRLIQISIPGLAEDDRTAFSQTKREAEQLIASSGVPYAILRPGFVIAPSAYGGSAMLRALATLPIELPNRESDTPFQPVAVDDIAATVAWLVEHDRSDPTTSSVTWDLMQSQPSGLGDVVAAFRLSFDTASMSRLRAPSFALDIAGWLGDLAAHFGWASPMRSTAIAELRRGVTGDPAPWAAATGITPKTLDQILGQHHATVQDKWFARLFLVKPLMIATLCIFWIASGSIALFLSYDAAAAILISHDFPSTLVAPITIGSSLMDITIGIMIAYRRSCAAGLFAGIIVSLGYMAGSALLAPDLWLEPLGALVKTGPAIVLMLVALLTLDSK